MSKVVTLNGLDAPMRAQASSVIVRVVRLEDETDLPYEVERFKRDWRRRGWPFKAVEVER